jgi:hypothetical protein
MVRYGPTHIAREIGKLPLRFLSDFNASEFNASEFNAPTHVSRRARTLIRPA